MRILVTDGENRAALAVTRSLGRRGHEIIVGEKHTPSLAQTSKYCIERVVYPDPATASEAFIDALERVVRQRRIDVVIPIADITTFLITEHRQRFDSCAIPCASAAAIKRAANKVDIFETGVRLGVAAPRSVVVADAGHVPDIETLGFPLVIKPRQSRVRTSSGWVSSEVSFPRTPQDLIRDLSRRPAHDFPLLLQERVVGPGIGVFACYRGGRPVALFSHRRLRERPPWGGVSVLSESVALPTLACEYATRLLDELEWDGVAMVEFKHDTRDDLPKLMEINGRFWGSLQLAIDAGVDFPALLMPRAGDDGAEAPPPYRIGVRNRWFWGDVDSLLLTLHRGTPDVPGRATALLEFAKFFGRDLYYENPKLWDLAPWWHESYRWFRTGIRDATSSARASSPALPNRASADAPVSSDTAATMSTRIVRSLDQIGLDNSQWNALAARSDTNSVFQTAQWTRSWWSTFGDQYQPLFVVASSASCIAGVAPMILERDLSGERVIRFLGDGRADYCDFIAAKGEGSATSKLFETVLTSGGWDVIELNHVPSESPTVGIVRTICERSGYRTLIDDQFLCPALVIQGHEQKAREIFEKPSLRRRQNYFEKAGRLACRDLSDAAEIHPYLEVFFNQHIARWAGTSSPSLFLNPTNQSFYRDLTGSLAETGWLQFSVVEFNGQPIAFHYGFDYDGVVVWYKPSFDVGHASRSPGLVLVRHLIGGALKRQRRELDFTLGDEPFKARFTNCVRRTAQIHIFKDSARFMLERSRRQVMGAIKRLSRN